MPTLSHSRRTCAPSSTSVSSCWCLRAPHSTFASSLMRRISAPFATTAKSEVWHPSYLPEFVFARFAWAIFHHGPVLFTTKPRVITVRNEDTEEWQGQTKDGRQWHGGQAQTRKDIIPGQKEQGKIRPGSEMKPATMVRVPIPTQGLSFTTAPPLALLPPLHSVLHSFLLQGWKFPD